MNIRIYVNITTKYEDTLSPKNLFIAGNETGGEKEDLHLKAHEKVGHYLHTNSVDKTKHETYCLKNHNYSDFQMSKIDTHHHFCEKFYIFRKISGILYGCEYYH